MPSADINNAVEGAYWGAFGTAGQRCTSLGNLILHKDIYDEFMDKFMAKVESTRIGNSSVHKDVLYGPMLSEKYGKDFLSGIEMAKLVESSNKFGVKERLLTKMHHRTSWEMLVKEYSCGLTSLLM